MIATSAPAILEATITGAIEAFTRLVTDLSLLPHDAESIDRRTVNSRLTASLALDALEHAIRAARDV